jgi:integrase/recombinase XerD
METIYSLPQATNDLLLEKNFQWQTDLPEQDKINVHPCIHKGEKRLQLRFRYNKELISRVRSIDGCRWSQTMRCWHVPDNPESIKKLTGKDLACNEKVSVPDIGNNQNTILSKPVVLAIDEYNQQIYIDFPFEEKIKNYIKKLNGSWWHIGIKKWSIDYSQENLEKLKEIFGPDRFELRINIIEPGEFRKSFCRKPVSHISVPQNYVKELKLQNKSVNTIRHYEAAIAGFLEYFKDQDIANLSVTEIRDFILYYREKLHYSPAFQNQMVSALKLFYRIVYEREIIPSELPRPKKSRSLPRVISREEVETLIRKNKNEKHRLMLMLLYGCGLRLGEVVSLRLEDIDFFRHQITICNGKGRKDRNVNLTHVMSEHIRKYLDNYSPSIYLFNGLRGKQYSRESVSQIVKNSAQRAGIKKKVTPHVLRHCYATHMLERGVDLRYIQYLLGHKSSRTTEIYTHISNYRIQDLGSPIDDLKL